MLGQNYGNIVIILGVCSLRIFMVNIARPVNVCRKGENLWSAI